MQIKIGEKIKELRARDGRTQNDLATAVGVSCQAVSRWESGGGYPDLQLMPAIANYFHVTIDELYGYHGDREEKIADILRKADEVMQPYTTRYLGFLPDHFEKNCLQMLRNAADEFPNEPNILAKLAIALEMFGHHKHGERTILNNETGLLEDDVAYNTQNIYWRELLQVYKKLLNSTPSPEQRSIAVHKLVIYYRKMGENEKAKALAMEQNKMLISQELLLPHATIGEENLRYIGQSILSLLRYLTVTIINDISTRATIYRSEYSNRVADTLTELHETIFCDGKYGPHHWDIIFIYLGVIGCEVKIRCNMQKALTLFDKMFDHIKAHNEFCKNQTTEEYEYSAPLICHAKENVSRVTPFNYQILREQYISSWPQEMISELRKNPKYAECFAE